MLSYFEQLDSHLLQSYIEVKHSVSSGKSWVAPEYTPMFREVAGICDSFDALIAEHKNMPMRAQTVAYRLLMRYTEFCRGLSKAFVLKSLGADVEAKEEYKRFAADFGKYELEMERYYDHMMMEHAYKAFFATKSASIAQ